MPTERSPAMTVEAHSFPRHGWVPNNPRFPVLLYHGAVPGLGGCRRGARGVVPAKWLGAALARRGVSLPPLSFERARGARLRPRVGPADPRRTRRGRGRRRSRRRGVPAGTGHCRLHASEDFLVVGAYPPGQDMDLCREAPSAEAIRRIAGARAARQRSRPRLRRRAAEAVAAPEHLRAKWAPVRVKKMR